MKVGLGLEKETDLCKLLIQNTSAFRRTFRRFFCARLL